MLPLQEVRRAGEHLITADALQLLLWEVHGAALATLQQLVLGTAASKGHSSTPAAGGGADGNSSSVSPLSEKGVLQLLFDQRFLRDVLAGGRSAAGISASNADPSSAVCVEPEAAARKALIAAVEQQLQVGCAPTSSAAAWETAPSLVLCQCMCARQQTVP